MQSNSSSQQQPASAPAQDFQQRNASHNQQAAPQQHSSYERVHEGIIDLYLQVKVRSNDEIDMFE